MHIFLKSLIPVLLGMLLLACSTGPYPASSPYFKIPAGTQIIVKQKISIPANKGRVYFQGGKLIPGKPERYHAHCWFLSWKVLEDEQVIKPGVFTVTGSQQYDEYVSNKLGFKLVVNSHASDIRSDGGPTAIERITTLKIHSKSQPDIREFSCSYWDAHLTGNHLTVAEMQKAVGALVEIKLK